MVQDWGGLLGLTLPVDHPDIASRLFIMNTGFAVGTPPGPGFMACRRDFVANTWTSMWLRLLRLPSRT